MTTATLHLNRNAIIARLEVVAMTLGLRDAEVDGVIASDFNTEMDLIDFAIRHGQSIDWLLLGDVRSMLTRLAAGGSTEHRRR